MSEDELMVLIISACATGIFLLNWYHRLSKSLLPERNYMVRSVMRCLPIVSFVIMLFTLKILASFDVKNDPVYITFYILLGYAWLLLGTILMFRFFDLSWTDDVVNLNNKAALIAISGGFIGLTLIYSGANIGDGPGWWCVVFAGGIGLIFWVLLGDAVIAFAGVSERITVDRDIGCGIRFGLYLIASGIILGRASGGDWTSFKLTVIEFFDVYDKWPVLLLTIIASIIEKFYPRQPGKGEGSVVLYSVLVGAFYVFIAIISIVVAPSLPKNPFYRGVM